MAGLCTVAFAGTRIAAKDHSRMGIVFLIVFTDLISFGMVIPLLPYYGL